jgi:hypothetical protein
VSLRVNGRLSAQSLRRLFCHLRALAYAFESRLGILTHLFHSLPIGFNQVHLHSQGIRRDGARSARNGTTGRRTRRLIRYHGATRWMPNATRGEKHPMRGTQWECATLGAARGDAPGGFGTLRGRTEDIGQANLEGPNGAARVGVTPRLSMMPRAQSVRCGGGAAINEAGPIKQRCTVIEETLRESGRHAPSPRKFGGKSSRCVTR